MKKRTTTTPLQEIDALIAAKISEYTQDYADFGRLPDTDTLLKLKAALTTNGVTVDTAKTICVMLMDWFQHHVDAATMAEIAPVFMSWLDMLKLELFQGNKTLTR